MLNQRKETAPDGDLPGIYGKLFALYDGKHLQLVLGQEVGPVWGLTDAQEGDLN